MQIIELLQITVSVLLIVTILMQSKGSSLGSGFGGDSFASYHTKRGFEKFLVSSSIVLSGLFLVLSLAHVWMS